MSALYNIYCIFFLHDGFLCLVFKKFLQYFEVCILFSNAYPWISIFYHSRFLFSYPTFLSVSDSILWVSCNGQTKVITFILIFLFSLYPPVFFSCNLSPLSQPYHLCTILLPYVPTLGFNLSLKRYISKILLLFAENFTNIS